MDDGAQRPKHRSYLGNEGRGTMPDRSSKFDAYARDYETLHAKSIEASGEEPTYFVTYKRRCIERMVGNRFDEPILDYGCGIGMLIEQLGQRFSTVDGYDPSGESIARARQRAPRATVYETTSAIPDGRYALAILACVLHHVPPAEREALLRRVTAKLKPTGRLVVFEHNPLNPVTRRAVAMCPFDDDAVLLWPREARRLLERSGLVDVRCDYIVFFPRALGRLRWIEPHLRALPLGAQTMLVGTRPG
jgi:2-polyprenyl-3-methyl-5-hydroxy-6-metoxy-1,4-benzoquinol methylase